jgi:hypothetical protein
MPKLNYNQYPFNSRSQIRLLEVKYSASGLPQWTFRQPINISADRKAQVACQFVAASYEWGAPKDVESFVIDGKKITLRSNLVKFLREIRNRHNIPPVYWIDSICINQDDPKEKMHQIQLLREIYSSASCVLSWLGPMGNGSNLAMKYHASVKVLGEDSVNALLNRGYWTRLWMVQEVVLGRKWYIACGSDVIDGEDLIRLLGSRDSNRTRRAYQWQESRAYNLIRERLRFLASEPTDLLDLMLRFYELDSEFKVDKIRALLALIERDSISNIHELLAHLDDSAGNHNRDKTVVVDNICQEICRLAGLTLSKDVASFVKGVLHGNIEKKSLNLIAERVRFSRMSMRKPPLPTTQSIGSQDSRSDLGWKHLDLMRYAVQREGQTVASALARPMAPYQAQPTQAQGKQAVRTPLHLSQTQFFRSDLPQFGVERQEVHPRLPVVSDRARQVVPYQAQPPKVQGKQSDQTHGEQQRPIVVQEGVVKRRQGGLVLERRRGDKKKRKAEKKDEEKRETKPKRKKTDEHQYWR